jgi:hypothetical protein
MSKTPWRMRAMLRAAGTMAGLTTATQPDLRQMRVDHTGGFRKPERLQDVYRRYAHGEATDDEVERLLSSA